MNSLYFLSCQTFAELMMTTTGKGQNNSKISTLFYKVQATYFNTFKLQVSCTETNVYVTVHTQALQIQKQVSCKRQ